MSYVWFFLSGSEDWVPYALLSYVHIYSSDRKNKKDHMWRELHMVIYTKHQSFPNIAQLCSLLPLFFFSLGVLVLPVQSYNVCLMIEARIIRAWINYNILVCIPDPRFPRLAPGLTGAPGSRMVQITTLRWSGPGLVTAPPQCLGGIVKGRRSK